jgi:hypothetical protein
MASIGEACQISAIDALRSAARSLIDSIRWTAHMMPVDKI